MVSDPLYKILVDYHQIVAIIGLWTLFYSFYRYCLLDIELLFVLKCFIPD